MRTSCILALMGLWLCICPYSDAQKMLVRAGATASQVNNHPLSYTTPGQANTNCSGTGTVNGTATDNGYGRTDISGTVNTNTNCNSTYTPPQTTTGNWATVDNASWVTNIANGDQYLIQCTAHWRGSRCSPLIDGDNFSAEIRGNDMFITGRKGLKPVTIKYKVLQFRPGAVAVKANVSVTANTPTVTSKYLVPDSAHPRMGNDAILFLEPLQRLKPRR